MWRKLDGDEDGGVYSIPLQIGGLFAVLISALLGFAFSYYLSKKLTHKTGKAAMKFTTFLLLFKGIGAGVIISTAMIHLIGESVEGFHESGLSDLYDPFPFATALFGMYIMAVFEYFSHKPSKKSCINHNVTLEEGGDKEGPEAGKADTDYSSVHVLKDLQNVGHGHGHCTVEHVSSETNLTSDEGSYLKSKSQLEIEQNKRTALVAEINIVVHSVLIGLDLGLQNDQRAKTLIAAVCFHQFFEGFALSQMIWDAVYNKTKTIIFAAFFAFTTPIGIGIGMAIHSTFDPESNGYLATVAFLDAFCGGMLLFLGLVNFLLPWFLHNKSLHISGHPEFAAAGFGGLFVGMAIMAVIGIWA